MWHTSAVPTVVAWLAFAAGAALPAQQTAAPKPQAEIDQQITQLLVAFARNAEGWKAPARARQVYEIVIDHYDIENAAARAGLGYKRVKDQWQQVTPADRLPKDTAAPAQQKLIEDAWRITRQRVVTLHRDQGLALLGTDERVRASYQFERALAFDPQDLKSHEALGHQQFDGFFGTPEQIAFVKRMREILARSRELAQQDYPVEALPESSLPDDLRGLPFTCAGARSKNFTRWVAGTAEEAADLVRWSERALALIESLVPEGQRKQVRADRVRWLVVIRTVQQRDALLDLRPATRGENQLEVARLYGGVVFKWHGNAAEWQWHQPANDADSAVGQVTKRCAMWEANQGLSEGAVHAMTWLLCGSLHASYMQVPATASGSRTREDRDPARWLAALRADVDGGKDWPLVQVPRERMENFREPVRMKAWSFLLWLMARHPEQWLRLGNAMAQPNLAIEDVEAKFQEVLGRSVGDCETEWRDWVRKGSVLGKASGLPD